MDHGIVEKHFQEWSAELQIPRLCHPEQLTRLRQVEGGTNNIWEVVNSIIRPEGGATLP